MEKTRIAIVGYGNIGRGVHKAINKNEELYGDMGLVEIITRRPEVVSKELLPKELSTVAVYNADSKELDIDVALLCGGSKNDLPKEGPYFAGRFNTVDSFDNHSKIPEYFEAMDEAARKNKNVAVISAGWDPGTFSLERVLHNAFIPGSHTLATYGLTERGGLSMGHSDAIRTIPGVKDARQYTHAIPDAVEKIRRGENPDLKPGDKMRRECFVVLGNDTPSERTRVSMAIHTMPAYFEPYETTVKFVDQEELKKDHSDMPHDGLVITRGETGEGNRALVEYRNEWASNPEGTAGVLVACARAAYRMKQRGQVGAYTVLNIPAADFSPHSKEELLKNYM